MSGGLPPEIMPCADHARPPNQSPDLTTMSALSKGASLPANTTEAGMHMKGITGEGRQEPNVYTWPLAGGNDGGAGGGGPPLPGLGTARGNPPPAAELVAALCPVGPGAEEAYMVGHRRGTSAGSCSDRSRLSTEKLTQTTYLQLLSSFVHTAAGDTCHI
jgi:hypothetical protein